MTEAERRKLLGYYRSLSGIERNLRDTASRGVPAVHVATGDTVADEVERIEKEFPALGQPSRIRELRQRRDQSYFYHVESLLTKVSVVVGRLSAVLEEAGSAPVTERKEFRFIHDDALRAILERDYLEIQKAYVASCWKAAIILTGGAIEAVLLDVVLKDQSRARGSGMAPNQSDMTRWDLKDLIAVCVDLSLVSAGVGRLSSPVREYRNLVHPGNELRSELVFAQEEARIALEVLNMVHRDLSRGW